MNNKKEFITIYKPNNKVRQLLSNGGNIQSKKNILVLFN